jgi:hypothetical protein
MDISVRPAVAAAFAGALLCALLMPAADAQEPACQAPGSYAFTGSPGRVVAGEPATLSITYHACGDPTEHTFTVTSRPLGQSEPVTTVGTVTTPAEQDATATLTVRPEVSTTYSAAENGQVYSRLPSTDIVVDPRPTCPPQATLTVPQHLVAGQPATMTVTSTSRQNWNATPDGYRRTSPAATSPITNWTGPATARAETTRSVSWTFTTTTSSRVWARYAGGCQDSQGRDIAYDAITSSAVVAVSPLLTISARRNGPRDYTFSGQAISRPNQTVSLYRVDAQGHEVLTARTASTASGTWTVRRAFAGSGRFGFVVRTAADPANAAGASRTRSTLIY